jgi:hypothetical protein
VRKTNRGDGPPETGLGASANRPLGLCAPSWLGPLRCLQWPPGHCAQQAAMRFCWEDHEPPPSLIATADLIAPTCRTQQPQEPLGACYAGDHTGACREMPHRRNRCRSPTHRSACAGEPNAARHAVGRRRPLYEASVAGAKDTHGAWARCDQLNRQRLAQNTSLLPPASTFGRTQTHAQHSRPGRPVT